MTKLAAQHKKMLGLELAEEDIKELARNVEQKRTDRKSDLRYSLGYNEALLESSTVPEVKEAAQKAIASIEADLANLEAGGNGYA